MPIYIPKIKVIYYSVSELLTIKEYLNLIGRESFLAITWEPDFPQACSFHRMLMSNKNFHFTQIPDKINDMIFLKVQKPCLWAIFARWRFFPKYLALSHITRYGPLTPCQVSEKTNEPILIKLTDRRKDGRKDGQTLFYRTLLTVAGV